jgi:hypothetical protein
VVANKEQNIVDKVNEIQKENRILLKKMLTIDLKPTKHNPVKINMIPTPSSYSLNRAQRIRELTRVTQENKMLLQRLQTAHSVYNSNKWEEDFRVKKYRQELLRKNADRFCQHPYFVMASEPRVMSATGTVNLGYNSIPLKNRRAQSNYSVNKRNKRRKKRLMTAGHAGRKRSAVGSMARNNRPITAKAPIIGRRMQKSPQEDQKPDDGARPDTVPFTNLGPLGETEPLDENDKIKAEITREVTGESEKDIEDRIANDFDDRDISEPGEGPSPEDKFNEKEKQMDNLTDDLSNNQEKQISDNENDEGEDIKPNINEVENEVDDEVDDKVNDQSVRPLDKVDEASHKESEVVEQPDTGAQPHNN